MNTNPFKPSSDFLKRPLGVLALYAIVLYTATVVPLSLSTPLGSGLQTTLVVFLIVSYFVTFGTFIYLLIYKSSFFYAPSDFRSDDTFVLLTKLKDKEIDTKLSEELQAPTTPQETTETEHNSGSSQVPAAHSKIIKPTVSKYKRVTKYLAKVLSAQFGFTVSPEVRVTLQNDKRETFDLFGLDHNTNKAVIGEIKFCRDPARAPDLVNRGTSHLLRLATFTAGIRNISNYHYVLIFVIDTDNPHHAEMMRDTFASASQRFYPEIDVLIFDIEDCLN